MGELVLEVDIEAVLLLSVKLVVLVSFALVPAETVFLPVINVDVDDGSAILCANLVVKAVAGCVSIVFVTVNVRVILCKRMASCSIPQLFAVR